MLILPLKGGVRYDLGLALATWLDDDTAGVDTLANPLEFVFAKPSFQSSRVQTELTRLQSLRNCLTDVFTKSVSHSHAISENGIDDCHEYHAILLEFEKRGFPNVEDRFGEHNNHIAITWKGAYGEIQKESHGTLIWERSCVALNCVALYTYQISQTDKSDRDSCKQSIKLCQIAATIASTLRQSTESQNFQTVDLSTANLLFWENYLLATAQDLIYQMAALSEQQNHAILSKVSEATYDLYAQALKCAQDPRLQSDIPKFAKDYAENCKAASMLAKAKASFHQAVLYRTEAKIGMEIAQLSVANNQIHACRDFLKQTGVSDYMRRECVTILPVISDRLSEAISDNDMSFHETIPTEVPDIDAKQLAKTGELPPTMLLPRMALFEAHV